MDLLLYFKQNPEKYYESERVWRNLSQTCAFLSCNVHKINSLENYDYIHLVDVDSEMKVDEAIGVKANLICSTLYGENDFGSILKYDEIGGYSIRKKAQRVLNKMDLILVPNDFAKVLLKSQGIHSPILPIANATDVDRFENNKEMNKMLFRRYYEFQINKKIVMVSMSSHSKQGILRAHQLAKKYPEYHFCYFGKVKAIIGSEIYRITKKPYKNETFFGIIDENLYSSALLNASAFLSLDDRYFGSVSLGDAMAAHCPIVASEKGSQLSPWINRQNACLFHNESKIEEAFLSAVGEEGKLKAEKAFEIMKNYTVKKEGELIKNAYSLLKKKETK